MPNRLISVILAAACLAPFPLAAEPAPPAVSGVTVTAPPPLRDDPKLDRKLEGFVRHYGAPGPVGQLARWTDKVCPAVSGLSAEDNAIVAERIRSLAVEVGAPVADETPCRRTVSVFFSEAPQGVLDVIRIHAPQFLGYHYVAQTKQLATFGGAIKAWYMTASGGAHGEALVDDPSHKFPGGNAGSRITTGIASQFAGVVIVADAKAIQGRDIAAVADYVAMLALSEAATDGTCKALPTILNLFAADCPGSPADRVTGVDLAYLRALYATDLGWKLELQQAQLVADMERSLHR